MSIPGLNLAQIDEDASPCDGVNCPLAPEIEQAKARADVIKNESVKAKEANDLQKVKDDKNRAIAEENDKKLAEEKRKADELQAIKKQQAAEKAAESAKKAEN